MNKSRFNPDTVQLPRRTTVASMMLGLLVGTVTTFSSVYADDTEVFFGQLDPDMNVFPNVLFVLDTSGSMNSGDSGYSGTRLERMKSALNTILDNSSNVNVGLMRFNGYYGGGAVLYPVTGIDQPICPNNDCGSISLSAQVSQDNDDMEQYVSSGQMTPGGTRLSLGEDDDDNPQLTSFRFQNLDIPSGVTITSATLEFTAEATRTGSADLVLSGQDVGDAPTIGTTDHYLTGQPRTTAVVNWQPDDWYIGNTYESPDVSAIVQEVTDRADWCGGQSMAFIVEGTGTRAAYTYNKSPSRAPILRITYDSDSIPEDKGCTSKAALAQIGSSSDDAYEKVNNGKIIPNSNELKLPQTSNKTSRRIVTRLRFQGLSVPPGATIESASIEFEVDEQRDGALQILIEAENVDSAPELVANNYWISNRPVVSSPVLWNIADSDDWPVNTKVSTPDIASHVQTIVNRSGWETNNDIAFVLRHTGSNNNRRVFDSYDGEQPAAAKLRVTYRTKLGASGGAQANFKTAREDMKKVVSELSATGGTPIVAAYYEAVQYMLGGPVDYGTKRGYYTHQYHRVSHPASYTGGSVSVDSRCTAANPESSYCKNEQINGTATYISPLADSCQTNHLVFLSDGVPTSNTAISRVKELIDETSCSPDSGNEACGRELASWLEQTDHNENISRKQNINTYTIGFNINSSFLADLATAGGGSYYDAASSEELVAVFQNILGDVLAVDTSFVAPGATVNQFNRLTHRNDIYFALFKPDQRPGWAGNLKRYHVGANSSGNVVIQDKNGKPAVDAKTGFFNETAKSWWTAGIDGSAVEAGGAASNISLAGPGGSGSRRVFTWMGTSIPSGGVDLTAAAQKLHEDNIAIDIDALGLGGGLTLANIERRNELLQWTRGIDLKDEDLDGSISDARTHMGDPMHAQPAILNYADGGSTKTTIFVATNEGLLHAVEHENGTELYAYMPK
ncbi:MAG: VWA domain-containing protein, partial [Granulosicoccus sp.]|nr:VWA domain-containing protein [Granulosicoccus sp.]